METGAFSLIGYATGMLLHYLQTVSLDEDREIPLSVQKDLEVKNRKTDQPTDRPINGQGFLLNDRPTNGQSFL